METLPKAASEELFPSDFIWRRLHSLMGFGLVVFITFHLFVNSLAALLPGEDSKDFISSVNSINNTALLPIVEIVFLGIPFFIHIVWGIKYLLTAKYNSSVTDGSAPSLPEYARNRAYTWQRITSWLLIFGIIAHVIHMRFVERPEAVRLNASHNFMTSVTKDNNLYLLADRLNATLYSQEQLKQKELALKPLPKTSSKSSPELLREAQTIKQQHEWVEKASKYPLSSDKLLAVSDNFGTAELLMMRDAFKNPVTIALYTLLVIAAVYHAFNGLWTFLICWGVTLSQRSQAISRKFCLITGLCVAFLGFCAIFGT